MNDIQLSFFPFRLNFKDSFRISNIERSCTDNVYVHLRLKNYSGWGECVFIPYYKETLETFKFLVSGMELPKDTENIKQYIQNLKINFPNSNFCIASIDIALHNLHTCITGKSISKQYQLIGQTEETSFTIGISSDQEIEQKLIDNPTHSYYKLKVNKCQYYNLLKSLQHK